MGVRGIAPESKAVWVGDGIRQPTGAVREGSVIVRVEEVGRAGAIGWEDVAVMAVTKMMKNEDAVTIARHSRQPPTRRHQRRLRILRKRIRLTTTASLRATLVTSTARQRPPTMIYPSHNVYPLPCGRKTPSGGRYGKREISAAPRVKPVPPRPLLHHRFPVVILPVPLVLGKASQLGYPAHRRRHSTLPVPHAGRAQKHSRLRRCSHSHQMT